MSDLTHPAADLKCLKCGSVGRRVTCQLCGEMLYCSTRCLRENEDDHGEPCELFRTLVRPAFANTNVARLFIGFLEMTDFHTCQLEREKAAIEKCLTSVNGTGEACGDPTIAAAASAEISEPQAGEVDLTLRGAAFGSCFGFHACVVDATFGGGAGVSELPALRFVPVLDKVPRVDLLLQSLAKAAVRDLQRAKLTVRFVAFDPHFEPQNHSRPYTLDGVPVFSTPDACLLSALFRSVSKSFPLDKYTVPATAFLNCPPSFAASIGAVKWPRFVRHATAGLLVPSPGEQWVEDWVRRCLWQRRMDLAVLLDAKVDQDMGKLKSKGKAIDESVLVEQQLARLQKDTVADFMRILERLRTAEPMDIHAVLYGTNRPLDASFASGDPGAAAEDEQAVCERLEEEIRQASDMASVITRLKEFEKSIKSALAVNDNQDLLVLVYQLDVYLSKNVDFYHWADLLKESTGLWRLICLKVKQFPNKKVKEEACNFTDSILEGLECAQQIANGPAPKRPKVFLDLNSVDGNGGERVRRVVITLFTDVNPKAANNFRCYCTGEKGVGTEGYPLHYKRTIIGYAVKGTDLVGGYLSDGNWTHMTDSIYGMYHSKWDHRRSLVAPGRPGVVSLIGEAPPSKRTKGVRDYKRHGGRFLISVSSANSVHVYDTVVGVIEDIQTIAHLHSISLLTRDDSSATKDNGKVATDYDMQTGPLSSTPPLIAPVIIQDCGQLPDSGAMTD
ncbi:unnamed protein product [Vitrella brassicaformis CCMP3155]|uniref:PPIase cyclophilin-type domain-containing protein n=2 Tax=Vitrella brassicaformis TaxID=1169539 RepID=A0A0G4GBH9_VITBC|nr:unnamed protein product [Vitrella brassicaformis CCMP3155]|mmetsp:Transcript_19352/g.55488  ORF Transcript_19352/g.55488 Transcript_19352/m.55488 type:complete len:730 (-) Transcript_19352:3027-5216(-)|eukprot:CEM26477.1 unnamed protein product [Vitrella brassicaformis CCMP3155]